MNTSLVFLLVTGVAALAYYVFKGANFSKFMGAGPAGLPKALPQFMPSAAKARNARNVRAPSKPRPEKKVAPITGKCTKCGQNVTMPFKCKYCGSLFCDDHRLPERHACDGL